MRDRKLLYFVLIGLFLAFLVYGFWKSASLDRGLTSNHGSPVMAPLKRPLVTSISGGPAAPDFASRAEIPATVKVGSTIYKISSNRMGAYPRIHVEPENTIAVDIGLRAGESMGVLAVDGGQLEGNRMDFIESADSSGHARFTFKAGKYPGGYRVALFVGGSRNFLDFWAGPELSQLTSRP